MQIEDYYSQLKNDVSDYFLLQSKKPFLQEILKGNLSDERYTYWVRVDYVYLINFSKILALGISKGKTIEEMKVMNEYLNWILNEEMSLHVDHAKKNGISENELFNCEMGPIKYSYTRHENNCANAGDLGILISGILACIVGWQVVSKILLGGETVSDNNKYNGWLTMYSEDKILQEHTNKILKIFNSYAANGNEEYRDILKKNFLLGVKYETMCWDAYYNMEEWI
tara:strand:+ start:63 stop:740 length:678 start_codon:yes stop_codon:yes gene_type:complete